MLDEDDEKQMVESVAVCHREKHTDRLSFTQNRIGEYEDSVPWSSSSLPLSELACRVIRMFIIEPGVLNLCGLTRLLALEDDADPAVKQPVKRI